MTDSGSIGVDGKIYVVTYTHDHDTLKVGDHVTMGCLGKEYAAIVRITDHTLHAIKDSHGQYVHLEEVKP